MLVNDSMFPNLNAVLKNEYVADMKQNIHPLTNEKHNHPSSYTVTYLTVFCYNSIYWTL